MKTGTFAINNGRAFEIDMTFDRVYFLCPACEKGYTVITDAASCCKIAKPAVRDRARRRFSIQLDTTQL